MRLLHFVLFVICVFSGASYLDDASFLAAMWGLLGIIVGLGNLYLAIDSK